MATKPPKKLSPDVPSKDGPLDVLQYTNDVPKSYVPEGFKDRVEFLKHMREEYQHDIDSDRHNREAGVSDKEFSAGEQWDQQVLKNRDGLPCLVINSIPQFTAQLVGDWRESRKAVKVMPSDDADTDKADIRGDLIRAIEMQSRAVRVYDTTFESMVQCGDGAFRIAVEYARNDVFDQDIFVRPIDDAFATVWDRNSVDPTGRDATHVFVDDILPKKEFERKWKDTDQSEMSSETRQSCMTGGWFNEDGFRVTEYWRMLERSELLTLFDDGSVHYIDKDNLEQLVQTHGKPLKTRLAPCTYAQMHLVTGFEILAGPYEYRLTRVPIIRMSGRVINISGRRVRHGIVRFMKDAARLKNFWRSVAAEQLGYAPKAQWMVTESAVDGREDKLRKAHLSRDPLLIFNDEAEFGKTVIRMEPPSPQVALMNEANTNQQDMKDVTGIHDASLGIRSNETSGRAINARQKEGDVASLTYYDNGDEAVLEAGDVINQLIPQVYDGTRTVRLVGPDEEIKFQRINDPMDPNSPDLSVGMYDVALTTGTSYTTRRVEAAQAMMDAIQVYPQLMQIAGDIVVKAQDWPGSDKLAERLKKTIPAQFLDPEEVQKGGGATGLTVVPQEQVQQAQAEMQALQQELAAVKADRQVDIIKVRIDAYNAETQRIRALSDNQVDGTQMEQDAISRILDHAEFLHSNEHELEVLKQTPKPSSPKS